jgi:hypothetical protein
MALDGLIFLLIQDGIRSIAKHTRKVPIVTTITCHQIMWTGATFM